MSQSHFSLTEISSWARDPEKFDLPNVQRGFVWKPYQIEDLWDSLLRGYPIGCFVLSKSEKGGNERYQILDGQQRATAIALGFEEKTFRRTNIKLFIDLDYTKKERDIKEYMFRVITKSHCWGYQQKDNTSTLDTDKIRKALDAYQVDNHLEESLDVFFPYDSLLPVPFSILLHGTSVAAVINDIKAWQLFEKVKYHFRNQKVEQDALFDASNFEEYLETRVTLLFNKVQAMLQEYPNIPALYLNIDKFSENSEDDQSVVHSNQDHREDDNKASDAIENLFVRLNSHGTPLSGEELNYSILKAHIPSELQARLEQACEKFMRPSRFIALLFRIFSNEPGSKSAGNLSLKVKAKVFQKAIGEDRSKFRAYLSAVLTDDIYAGKTLLEYLKLILAYHPKENPAGFPYIVYARIAESAPEIMFVLLYRVKVKGDMFYPLSNELHRLMLGTISLLYWVGKGDRVRDHRKLLKNIWPSVSMVQSASLFWSKATLNRARLNDVMEAFPKLNGKAGLKSFFTKRLTGKRSDRDPMIYRDGEEVFETFFRTILSKRDLVAFSQRQFLYDQFFIDDYVLEDTDVPFDWDHISPLKAIGLRNVAIPLERVYYTIGNLRAWPYSLNRMDQGNTPCSKFDPLKEENTEQLLNYFGTKLKRKLSSKRELTSCLLQVSECEKGWSDCSDEKLRHREQWLPVYKLILSRNLRITENWFRELLIDRLQPEKVFENFEGLFYADTWDKNAQRIRELRKILSFAEGDYWYSKAIRPGLFIFYGYLHNKALDDRGFQFGVVGIEEGAEVLNMKIPEKDQAKYVQDSSEGCTEVSGFFTLISTEKNSYHILLADLYQWIRSFPDKGLSREITNLLTKQLKKGNTEYFTKT